MLKNLNKGDRFNIVRFSTEANSLFSSLESSSKQNIEKARVYIEDLKAVGGTNIDEALELALQSKRTDNRPFYIVFLTDGKPTLGETQTERLLKKVKNQKIQLAPESLLLALGMS